MPALRPNNTIEDARSRAADYEASLEPTRRKRLGQFFSGLSLSRLLASIALDPDASTVIDPMAGHGDLLDAAIERASRRGRALTRVQGVEIDHPTAEMCMRRLEGWHRVIGADAIAICSRDAFDVDAAADYVKDGYDLVITNPPYVRYQTQATAAASDSQRTPDEIRRDLRLLVGGRTVRAEWPIWETLIDGYSGLADLSVPAWILAAALVRPGGALALVAPATWRSRDYGDIIQYLLARCFRLTYLIEDTQPGWFSDALVRTQLVVGRRRSSDDARVPMMGRSEISQSVVSVKVSPPASADGSLVGSAFPGEDSEKQFADWLRSVAVSGDDPERGLAWNVSSLGEITESALASIRRRNWFFAVEPEASAGPLFQFKDQSSRNVIPAPLKTLLDGVTTVDVVLPEEAGLFISQGLRTGCNGFFYVDVVEETPDHLVRVRLSSLFKGEEVVVPADCLVPVVRRQSEVAGPVKGRVIVGRVLDLTRWVLPEDAETVQRARHLYEREGSVVPSVMPLGLANLVRRAADTVYEDGKEGKRVSELSAVKTNARGPGADRPPRFWYMLPPFVRRHRPQAFVARINQGVPWVEVNDDPPALIDANFSTIWGEERKWSRFAIRALLNSSWCRACMEALGTPLGGGALKLEATHLKRLPIPVLTGDELSVLDSEGRALIPESDTIPETIDRLVIKSITRLDPASVGAKDLIKGLQRTASSSCQARQRP